MTPRTGFTMRKSNKCYNDKVAADFGISRLLVKGNKKIGENVWHFSTTPGCCGGTCFGTCQGCYGLRGRYVFESVKKALAIRTWIVRNHLDWFVSEIIREIKRFHVEYVRIHVTGDFFSPEYVMAWDRIVKACPDVKFWSYTKSFGHGFDDALRTLDSNPNCNIVKSIVDGCGYNFGHCGYILDTYYKLLSAGKNPFICPCGVHDTTHCDTCHKCAEREYVLFLEHSTGYDAKKDTLYPEVVALVNSIM